MITIDVYGHGGKVLPMRISPRFVVSVRPAYSFEVEDGQTPGCIIEMSTGTMINCAEPYGMTTGQITEALR